MNARERKRLLQSRDRLDRMLREASITGYCSTGTDNNVETRQGGLVVLLNESIEVDRIPRLFEGYPVSFHILDAATAELH